MKNQFGFTMTEVIIAIALLGMVGTAILHGMGTITKTAPLVDDKTTSLNIAETQLENIRSKGYDVTGAYTPLDLTENKSWYGFTLDLTVEVVDCDGVDDGDDGLQKITVVVNKITPDGLKHACKLESYKLDNS